MPADPNTFIGKTVHFVVEKDQCRAAIIVGLPFENCMTANLAVFPDVTDAWPNQDESVVRELIVVRRSRIEFSLKQAVGTWHWPH